MIAVDLQSNGFQATTEDIDFRVASTLEERIGAFELVYNSYLRAGLGQSNPYGLRLTPYHLLPTTEVFIAVLRQEVICTVSLVIDGELGLPMESVYASEVAQWRKRGLLLGEVTCLADRRSQFTRLFPVFLRLCRLMVQYARRRQLDALLVAVHPRHARFYSRFMDFHTVGNQKAYPAVRNHPAVALSLDFARIDRERPTNYDTFFGHPLPEAMLQPQPITEAQREHFRAMVDFNCEMAPLGATGRSTGDAEVVAHVA